MSRFILKSKKAKALVNYKCYKTVAVIDSDFQTTIKTPKKLWDDIPGPLSLPVIGQLLHYTPYFGPLHMKNEFEKQKYFYEKYGPIVRLEGLNKNKSLYLFDPKDFIKVYKNEFYTPIRGNFASFTYYKKKYKKTEEEQQKPTSLMTDKGDNWRTLRHAINPLLLKPGALSSYEEIIDDISEEMVLRFKQIRDRQNNIKNIFIELSQAAVDAVSSVSFGYRIYGINASEDSPQRKIIEAVTKCLQVAEDLDVNPRYGLWKYFHTPSLNKAIKLYEEHERLVEYFINDSLKNASTTKGNDVKSFFNQLQEIDKTYALGFASDTLFAGVFTVSSMITFILYNLAKNPEVQSRLREEICRSDDDKYLKAVIKESMRVTPVVSRIKRTTTKDLTIEDYLIPKDTVVTLCHHFASMQENQFPRPLEFIPERWLGDKDHSLHYSNANPYAFMPFGSGIRICIGKRLADMELEKFVKNIIRHFQISWNSSEEPVIISKQSNFIVNADHLQFNDVQ